MLKKTWGFAAIMLFLGILSIGIVSPVSAADVAGPVFSIWYGKYQVSKGGIKCRLEN